jgi:SynChlorMet cassette radical SAM/SPASM protein ScmE
MRTPRSIDILITGQCNLHCRYCSHFSSDGDVARDLPLDAWLQFFEELQRLAVVSVCFQGGEPLMRDDLPDLLQGVIRNRMRFSLLTNGTLITDDFAAFCAASRRCDSVQVSIDGSTAEIHDSFRGSGSFERSLRGLRCLLRHGLPTTVRVTVHRRNVHDLDAISRLLLEDLGLPGFSVNSAAHLGLCRSAADQVQLNADDRSRAMADLLRLQAKYEGRVQATAGPLAEGHMWSRMEEAGSTGQAGLPRGGRLTGCGCVWKKLAVRADGAMLVCGLLPGIVLGWINQDSLIDVWRNHPELHRFRTRSSISLTDFPLCRDCEYASYCTGNCPALSYAYTGDPHQPAPDACLKRFLNEGGVLPDWLAEREPSGDLAQGGM